ncbi:MAG: hypothetical protein AB7P18_34265 [Candidatus Binatia bacterium]
MDINLLLVIAAALWVLAYSARPKDAEFFSSHPRKHKSSWHRRERSVSPLMAIFSDMRPVVGKGP